MRLAVLTQRLIVRHIASSDLSNRGIASLLCISPTTVAKIRLKLKQSQENWDQLATLCDEEFLHQLGTAKADRNKVLIHPDYSQVHMEMQARDMTLMLLHHEYLKQFDECPEKAVSYTSFTQNYRRWLKKQSISMRQVHKAGEKMFVDFCGKTMPITNANTGDISYAQIFVAVLGASGYTFAYAVSNQKLEHWLLCHIKAFEYFQGVPQQIIPDNLKAAVIKHRKDYIVLNPRYADFAEYYHCILCPARPRKPKDKSLAEIMVQIVQRWVLAALRNYTFFSIEQLNKEIFKKLEILNSKKTKRYPNSREKLFEDLDKPNLQPLPDGSYFLSQWRYNIRVPNDYHVEFKDSYYSVPYQYIGQLVDIRQSNSIVEILLQNRRITSHRLRTERGISTYQEHRPIAHQYQIQNQPEALMHWAKEIGIYVHEWVLKNLRQRRDYSNGLKAIQRLRSWIREEQNLEEVEFACKYALKYEIFGFQALKDIVKNKSYLHLSENSKEKIITHTNIRGANYYKAGGNHA